MYMVQQNMYIMYNMYIVHVQVYNTCTSCTVYKSNCTCTVYMYIQVQFTCTILLHVYSVHVHVHVCQCISPTVHVHVYVPVHTLYLSLFPSKLKDKSGCTTSSGLISLLLNLAPILRGLW